MISKLSYKESHSFDPYANLALEEFLTFHCEREECILYLWQNQRTVVIGKNQNAWKECKVNTLEADGGHLVRRMSGGGAVYHDTGNLNFTFCVRKENYDVNQQLQVIVEAARCFGLQAEQTGRNDIYVDGRKFSGNAFFASGDFCYHHGTILVDVDMKEMSKYLNVSKEKLASKSVDSVRARVVNLSELKPRITVESFGQALREAFATVYDGEVHTFPMERLNQNEVDGSREKYASWEWNYGRKIPFDYEMTRRYLWGNIDLKFRVNSGIVEDVIVYSDAMNQEYISGIGKALKGCVYQEDALMSAIAKVPNISRKEAAQVTWDLGQLIKDNI